MDVKFAKKNTIKMEIYKNTCAYIREKNLLSVKIVQLHFEHHHRFLFLNKNFGFECYIHHIVKYICFVVENSHEMS